MEHLCQNKHCKRKLTEYQELTSKLYDDLAGFLTEMRDKETFVQKVAKERNDYHSEVAELNYKFVNLLQKIMICLRKMSN